MPPAPAPPPPRRGPAPCPALPAPAPAPCPGAVGQRPGWARAPDVAGLLGMPGSTFRYRYLGDEGTLADLEALALVLRDLRCCLRDLILARGRD